MNHLNERRSEVVEAQSVNLRAEDILPIADFTIPTLYGLIAHIPPHITNTISSISQELQAQFPEQYYYDPSQYHVTIVPVPYTMEVNQIVASIAPLVKGWRLPISVRGVAINPFQIGAVFYPEEETLASHRRQLRSALGITEQAYTQHNPVWEELLWVNFLRFTTKPDEALLRTARSYLKKDLGSFTLQQYELYEISTKTLDPASSRLLHTFTA